MKIQICIGLYHDCIFSSDNEEKEQKKEKQKNISFSNEKFMELMVTVNALLIK